MNDRSSAPSSPLSPLLSLSHSLSLRFGSCDWSLPPGVVRTSSKSVWLWIVSACLGSPTTGACTVVVVAPEAPSVFRQIKKHTRVHTHSHTHSHSHSHGVGLLLILCPSHLPFFTSSSSLSLFFLAFWLQQRKPHKEPKKETQKKTKNSELGCVVVRIVGGVGVRGWGC